MGLYAQPFNQSKKTMFYFGEKLLGSLLNEIILSIGSSSNGLVTISVMAYSAQQQQQTQLQ